MRATQLPMQLMREPLLQFLLLGGLLFAIDHYALTDEENPRKIVIDAEQRRQLIAIFEDGQGRQPGPEELQDLIVQWTQNEVLYREARRMGLDQGDEMIRQRLILKLRNVLFGNVVLPSPSESELKKWFEANRDRFEQPPSFDFEQFRFADKTGGKESSKDGNTPQEAARALAQQLGTEPAPADQVAQVRAYQKRPATNLADLFGRANAERLIAADDGQWVVVESDRAVHLARITGRYAETPLSFKEARSLAARHYEDEARKASLAEALKGIVDKFEIVITPDGENDATIPAAQAADSSSNSLQEAEQQARAARKVEP